MSFAVSWFIEQQVILVKVTGEFTVEDIASFDKDVVKYLRAGRQGALTHVVVDLLEVTKFPTNVGEINQHANARKEENMGWVVIVSENRLIRFVANVITQLTKTRFRNFPTIPEAIDFLQTQDTSIDWSQIAIDYDQDNQ